jgi:hypothetical protein
MGTHPATWLMRQRQTQPGRDQSWVLSQGASDAGFWLLGLDRSAANRAEWEDGDGQNIDYGYYEYPGTCICARIPIPPFNHGEEECLAQSVLAQ